MLLLVGGIPQKCRIIKKKSFLKIPWSIGERIVENCKGASYTMQNRVGRFVN